jgi:hypothetical protein
MLTEAELAEMLDIRRKIDALQMRYNQLAAKMAAPPPAAGQYAAVPVAPQPVPMTPTQPVLQPQYAVPQPAIQPVVQPQPLPQPVAQPYVQQAPQPYVQPLAPQPVAPTIPQPVYAQPVAQPVQPMVQPVAPQVVQPMPVAASAPTVRPQGISASQLSPDELETKRIPLGGLRSVAAPVMSKDPANMTLKDHVADVLAKAGKPLSFEEIYKRLEDGKIPLPKDKPKLMVRQILYNKALFQVTHGAFSLVSGSGSSSTPPVHQKNPVLGKTPPADLFKNRLDALLGKK